jgi:hypothetical protein
MFSARFATDAGASTGSDLDSKTAPGARFFQTQESQAKVMGSRQFAQFLLGCMLGGK